MSTRVISAVDLLAGFEARLRTMSAEELMAQERRVAALPGRLAGELRRLVDAEREVRLISGRAALAPVLVPDWRAVYPSGPPDLRLEIGPWCRIDDTHLDVTLDGWICVTCGGGWNFQGRRGRWLGLASIDSRVLARQLAIEDQLDDLGLLHPDRRTTCSTCRAWASPEHVDSEEHWATIDAAADLVTDADLARVACPVPVPDGVRGMCWRARPCPDHDVDQVVDDPVVDGQLASVPGRDRVPRDRVLAVGIGVGVAAAGAYGAGRLAAPWEPLVPDRVVAAVAAALAAAGLLAMAAALLARWWTQRRYAHNELIGAVAELGLPAEVARELLGGAGGARRG